jgi:hypothetical protein
MSCEAIFNREQSLKESRYGFWTTSTYSFYLIEYRLTRDFQCRSIPCLVSDR